MSERSNIKFYGIHDMSSGYYLKETEAVFQNWDDYISGTDINTMLELYNIKKFFDIGARLDCWDDEQYGAYHEKSRSIPRILGVFCTTISDDNLIQLYQSTDCTYWDDFWELICVYKVYRRISPAVLEKLLETGGHIVWQILYQNELSTAFGEVIANHLLHNNGTAPHLVSHYLTLHGRDDPSLNFPREFTQSMRDKVLAEFVNRDDANINTLQLIAQAQSSGEFPLSDRLRRDAKKKMKALQEKLFANSPGMTYGANVTFRSIPNGSVEMSYDRGVISCAYSREWIEENQDYPTLLNNFIYLFEYVDRCFRCSFVSLKNKLGVFERILGAKGNKEYVIGIDFRLKQSLSSLQMATYSQELRRLGIQIENIFQWFFEEYLRTNFGANGFTYFPPSSGTSFAEKCKLMCSAIDGILKQYRLYCEDGFVDRELLEMSSGHVVFSEIPSMIRNKYAYAASETVQSEMFLLFSDQSMMNYTEKTRSKYQTLPELLLSEKMKKEDFREYQRKNLDWLLEHSDLAISEDGYITVVEKRVSVLKDLFENEVICPIYYGCELREQVDILAASGDLRYKGTLFSRPEQDYLNFMLNKAEFSNGLDLRNRYIHDTCSLNEEMQQHDYLEILKIMALIIIKINEEFCEKTKMGTD